MPNPTETLKPCPFCGGKADFYFDWQTAGVECTALKRWPVTCEVAPRTGTKRTREEAIDAWNTRLDPEKERLAQALVDHNDRLRSACSVADRNGQNTNWRSLRGEIHYTLAEHHETVNEARATLNSETNHG